MSDVENVDGVSTNEDAVAPATQSDQVTDPLDAITDPDELRSKAKGYRAERNRLKDKGSEAQADTSQFVTKQDQLRNATKEAKDLVSEDIRTSWDKLVDYIPTKHRGAETPKEIAVAMKLAQAAYLAENPPQDTTAADTTAQLQKDAGNRGTAPKAEQAVAKEEPSWAKKPKDPSSWYKKPE